MKKRIAALWTAFTMALVLCLSSLPVPAEENAPGGTADTTCLCTAPCTEESINPDCPVCASDIALCQGEAPVPEPPANIILREGTITTAEALKQAVADASGEVTLTLSGRIELDETLVIPSGKSITLNGDGVLAPSLALAEKKGVDSLVTVEQGAALTIDGITLDGSADPAQGSGAVENLISCRGALTLNSGTLTNAVYDASSTTNIGIVEIWGSDALFEMYGGSIENNSLSCISRGGTVFLADGSTFNMYGGSITGNSCTQVEYALEPATAGVMVVSDLYTAQSASPTSFHLYDGIISENVTSGSSHSAGGGVCLYGPDWNNWNHYARMTMSGGTISDNTTVYGGGGVFIFGLASLEMTGGSITGNTLSSGLGGGVCAYDGLKDQGLDDETIAYYSTQYKLASFLFDGGTISGNTANADEVVGDNGCGGGIYIATMNADLRSGTISGNTAQRQGGGIYVGSTPYVLRMKNTVVKNNTASLLGGGLWFCPTGDVTSVVTNGSAIYDNSATSSGTSAGDDIAIVPQGDTHYADLSVRMLGGGRVTWYRDGHVTDKTSDGKTNVLGLPDLSLHSRYQAGVSQQVTQIDGNQQGLAVKCIADASVKSLAESQATLWVTGNSSMRGGGIGSNGGVFIGVPDQEYELIVSKDWADTAASEQTEVTVNLKVGSYTLDGIKLNAANNWTASFTGLPDPASLTGGAEISVEEQTPDGFTVSYSEPVIDTQARTIRITVTNTPIQAPGNLTVSKTVTGSAGDSGKSFHFTVTLSDSSINGTYGGMTFTNGVAVFALKHGESLTASGLPAGIAFTVTEEEANRDGYTTSSTGASGTIPEGGTSTAAFLNKAEDPGTPATPAPTPTPEAPASTPISQTPAPVSTSIPQTADTAPLGLLLLLVVLSAGMLFLLGRKFLTRR